MMNGVRKPVSAEKPLPDTAICSAKLRYGNGDARQFSTVRSVQRTRGAWRSNLSQTLVHTYLELIQTDRKRHIAVASTGTGSASLLPHFSHPGRHVDPYLRFGLRSQRGTSTAMGTAFEEIENTVWNKAAAQRQNMAIG